MFGISEAYRKRMDELSATAGLKGLNALECYYDGGRRWSQGAYGFFKEQKCMMGALHYIQATQHISIKHTYRWLEKSVRQLSRPDPTPDPRVWPVEIFNDTPGRTYAEVAAVIAHAKRLAMAALPTPVVQPVPMVRQQQLAPSFQPKQPAPTVKPAVVYEAPTITIDGSLYEEVTTPRFEAEVAEALRTRTVAA